MKQIKYKELNDLQLINFDAESNNDEEPPDSHDSGQD